MILKGIIETDTVNYKKVCMTLEFPKCDFKCDRECGQQVCQNSTLATAPSITIDDDILIQKYLDNSMTEAICFQGLEPFDTPVMMINFIIKFREKSDDDIVIYTGYNKGEINKQLLNTISKYKNIIIKFGRYIPEQNSHYDKTLGVNLASDNQYAEEVS